MQTKRGFQADSVLLKSLIKCNSLVHKSNEFCRKAFSRRVSMGETGFRGAEDAEELCSGTEVPGGTGLGPVFGTTFIFGAKMFYSV